MIDTNTKIKIYNKVYIDSSILDNNNDILEYIDAEFIFNIKDTKLFEDFVFNKLFKIEISVVIEENHYDNCILENDFIADPSGKTRSGFYKLTCGDKIYKLAYSNLFFDNLKKEWLTYKMQRFAAEIISHHVYYQF